MSEAANISSMIEYFIGVWNAHDVDSVVEFFTDDAVLTIVPALPTMPDAYAGKQQILGFIQANMPGFSVEARDYEALGNTVTWLAVISSAGPWLLGVTPVTAMAEAVLDRGKIRSLTIILSEESVTRLLTAWKASNRDRRSHPTA